MQEVWLEIVAKLDGFQGDHAVEQLRWWMCIVVRTKVAAVFRDLRRHSAEPLDNLPEEPEDGRGRASAGQEKAERLGELFLIWLKTPRRKTRTTPR